jgi:hypothetical protein
MIRKTLTLLSLIGLLLSVGLWGASYFNLVRATHRSNNPIVISGVMNENWQGGSLALIGGALKYGMGGFGYWPLSDGRMFQASLGAFGEQVLEAQPPRWISRGRTDFTTHWRFVYMSGRVVVIPLWMPTVLFGVLPTAALVRVTRNRRRRKLGQCLKCGYDLRGSSERCPECGTSFEEKVKQP